jgi:hypothetical protein
MGKGTIFFKILLRDKNVTWMTGGYFEILDWEIGKFSSIKTTFLPDGYSIL